MTTKKTSSNTSNLVLGAVAVASLGGGAYMWWRGKQMKRPPLTGNSVIVAPKSPDKAKSNVLWTPMGPILIRPIQNTLGVKTSVIALSAQQRAVIAAQTAIMTSKLRAPVLPTYSEILKNPGEARIKKGLLGKLVAAYWGYAHTRLWYMSRCHQYHAFDDTPVWLAGSDAKVSEERYLKHLKTDNGSWPIGVSRSFAIARFDNSIPGTHGTYTRNTSLDRTFPNWSMPFGGYSSVFDQGGVVKGYRPKSGGVGSDDCWINWGYRRMATADGKFKNPVGDGCVVSEPSEWPEAKDPGGKSRPPFKGVFSFGRWPSLIDSNGNFNGNNTARDIIITRDWKFTSGHSKDRNVFAELVEGHKYRIQFKDLLFPDIAPDMLSGYPGRIWGKVSSLDRAKATYSTKKIPDAFIKRLYKQNLSAEENKKTIEEEFSNALNKYYSCGYNLVNTVLDILIDRGHMDLEKEFPDFVEHCNWWWILPPKKSMLAYVTDSNGSNIRMPRLSDIGGGTAGLYDIPSQFLVDYVMGITPKPGTVEPWIAKGPCWLWPKQLGPLIPTGAPSAPLIGSKNSIRSDKIDKWASWGTSVTYLLNCFNDVIYNYVVGVVGDAAGTMASDLMAEWTKNLSGDMLASLEDKLGSSFENIKDMAAEIATFTSIVEKVDIGPKLNEVLSKVSTGDVDIYATIKKLLTETVDGAPNSIINPLKDRLESQMQVVRDWGWQDDLLGDFSSVGSKFNKVKDIKSSAFGYDYNPLED